MSKYIIRIDWRDGQAPMYFAKGRNYKVAGESFVPLTDYQDEARRFATYNNAKKHAENRKGENLYGDLVIVEVES